MRKVFFIYGTSLVNTQELIATLSDKILEKGLNVRTLNYADIKQQIYDSTSAVGVIYRRLVNSTCDRTMYCDRADVFREVKDKIKDFLSESAPDDVCIINGFPERLHEAMWLNKGTGIDCRLVECIFAHKGDIAGRNTVRNNISVLKAVKKVGVTVLDVQKQDLSLDIETLIKDKTQKAAFA